MLGALAEPPGSLAVSLTELEATGRAMDEEFAALGDGDADALGNAAAEPGWSRGACARVRSGTANACARADGSPRRPGCGPLGAAPAASVAGGGPIGLPVRVAAAGLGAADDTLSDLDDDEEMQNVILNDEERRIKSALWLEANKDYLEQQEGWRDDGWRLARPGRRR